ncbi:MAG: helix-turn-helix transcriptional regulator [Oscillospiraceae bacterium]|nr:helix-turn-helix transcriptional regulator [Oscillospiraceae bacterium]
MLLRIAELRKKIGKSQAELGVACGVNQKAVSQWENGTCLPSCDKLPALASSLGCSISEIFVLDSVADFSVPDKEGAHHAE